MTYWKLDFEFAPLFDLLWSLVELQQARQNSCIKYCSFSDYFSWLFQAYKVHLATKGQDAGSIDATITLLSHSSKMIKLFRDKFGIQSVQDSRLKDLSQF